MPAFPLSIVQVEGPQRGIILTGGSLPLQGMTVGGTQRTNVDWYAGNRVGSGQPNGPVEDPIMINGEWHDPMLWEDHSAATLINFPKLSPAANPGADYVGGLIGGPSFLGTTPVPTQEARTTRAIADALDRMRVEGMTCQFEWGHILRYGLISHFTATWRLSTDASWELEFEVTGQELGQPKPNLVPTGVSIGLLAALLRLIREILDKITAILLKGALWIGRINAGLDRFVSYLLELADLLEQITTIANAPRDFFQRLRASLGAVVATSRELILNTSLLIPSAQVDGSRSGDPADVADFTVDAAELRALILRAGAEAAERSLAVEQSIVSDLQGVIVAQSAMTLFAVAKRAYGDGTKWQAIRDFNNFRGSIVPVGTLIRIPTLTS